MKTKNKLTVIATVSSKNQITIPKEIRRKLDIHSRDKLAFEIQEDGSIVIKKEQTDDFWSVVAEHQKEYVTSDNEEFEWGEDVGDEVIF